MVEQDLNSNRKNNWDEEKRDFARQAFKEALVFMKEDNKIIGDFSVITGVLAQYLKDNPSEIVKLNNMGDKGFDAPDLEDLTGAGFGQDLLGIIRDIIVDDKKFFLALLGKLFKL